MEGALLDARRKRETEMRGGANTCLELSERHLRRPPPPFVTSHWGHIQKPSVCSLPSSQSQNTLAVLLQTPPPPPPESSHVCRCCPVTGTLVAQPPCFFCIYLFLYIFGTALTSGWIAAATGPRRDPRCHLCPPADRGQIFFSLNLVSWRRFIPRKFAFSFRTGWSAARPRASVICQRRAAGRTSRVLPFSLSAFAFSLCFKLICSQTLLGRSGQQSGGLARWTRFPRGAARMLQLTASFFFPDSLWSCPSVALQKKKERHT